MAPLTVTVSGIATTYDYVPPSGIAKTFPTLIGTNRTLVGYKFTVSIPCTWEVPPNLAPDTNAKRTLSYALTGSKAWEFWNVNTNTMLTKGGNDYIWSVTTGFPQSVSLVPGISYCFFSILTSTEITGYYYTAWPLKDRRFNHLYDQVTYTHASGQVTSEPYAVDNVVRKNFSSTLPYPINSMLPVVTNISPPGTINFPPTESLGYFLALGHGEGPTGLEDGGFEWKFSFPTTVVLTTPEEPLIYNLPAQFNITLPTEWRVTDLKQWTLEYAISSDNGVWSEWQSLASIPGTQFVYSHSNVDVNKYYRYRYQIQTRAQTSAYSEMAQAGRPNPGAFATVQAASEDIQDGAIIGPKLGDTALYTARAASQLTGGGVIATTPTTLSWSTRFIVMAQGRASGTAVAGYFDISMPANGTVIPGFGGAPDKTVSGGVITFNSWEALYYVLPLGSASPASLAANFRVVSYAANVDIPYDWIKIAQHNADSLTIHVNAVKPPDYHCEASLTVDQAVVTATTSTVKVATALSDPYLMLDSVNNRINILYPGLYYCSFSGYWQDNAAGRRMWLLTRSGSAIARQTGFPNADNPQATISIIRRFTVGQWVSAQVYQNSGGNLNLVNDLSNASAILTVTRVGD